MSYEITYYSDSVQTEVLGLPKKTDKTPAQDMDIARKRLKEIQNAHP